MKWSWLAACGLVFAIGIGCSSGPGDTPETGTVSGTLTLDGEPIEGATVVFQPTEGRSSTGVSDAQGHYVLRYTGSIDGAKVGEHEVTVTTVSGPNPYGNEAEKQGRAEEIPKKYETEKITVTVEEGDNTIDLPLTSD